MNQYLKIIIFIGLIIAVFFGLIALQIQSENTGQSYPKWPAIPLIIGAYLILFPKNKKSE